MTDKGALSGIKNLLYSYKLLLSRNGLTWLTDDNKKIAVYHFFVICPYPLRLGLQFDLELSCDDLRTEIKWLMAHAITLSKAFQLVDNGAAKERSSDCNNKKRTKDDDTYSNVKRG